MKNCKEAEGKATILSFKNPSSTDKKHQKTITRPYDMTRS